MVGLDIREIKGVQEKDDLITKTCRVGKNTLRFFVHHKYALAVAVWSYMAIEVGAMAMNTMREGYVYDVDSCRERLCNYWNNSTKVDSGLPLTYLESRCHPTEEKYEAYYSFMKCLQDLCKYTQSIGEKFYACPKLPGISNKVVSFWNKFCPKKGNKSPKRLSEFSYLNKCIKKLCKSSKMRSALNKDTVELCKTKSVEKLYDFLGGINKSLKKLQKNTESTDSWTQAGVIGAVVGGVAGLIGGAAGIASTIVTYHAGRAATAAIGGAMMPTLSEGLENIVKTTTETAIALLQQATYQSEGMIPTDTLNELQELSAHIEEYSLSYYSAEEAVPHKGESENHFDPMNKMEIAGALEGEANGAKLGSDRDLTAIGSHIIKTFLANISNSATIEDRENINEATLSTVLSPIETSKLYFPSTRDALEGSIFSSTPASHVITKTWVSYLKATLPYWQDSFCFYEKPTSLLVCRLPLPRHRSEKKISFFMEEIEKFFSENLNSLCHYFRADLWCNWEQFLDLMSAKRNISFFMDRECPWDQFALSVNQVLHHTYRVDAIGECYNETMFIKV